MVMVDVDGQRREVKGNAACMIAYLVGHSELLAELNRMGSGQVTISFGPGGPYRAWTERHYPSTRSSNLLGESS